MSDQTLNECEWKVDDLWLGKIIIGSVWCNSMRSKDSPVDYCASCVLPGVGIRGKFPSMEKAKEAVEYTVAKWFKKTGLK